MIHMYSGPIYDSDNNGLMDESISDSQRPTHIYVVLMRCKNGEWTEDLSHCANESQLAILSFVLPIVERDINCLDPIEYIFRHTVRIKDIELLMGDEWFIDRGHYSLETSTRLRTEIVDQLWQLELPETGTKPTQTEKP